MRPLVVSPDPATEFVEETIGVPDPVSQSEEEASTVFPELVGADGEIAKADIGGTNSEGDRRMTKQFNKRNIFFCLPLLFLLAACQLSETPEVNYADYKGAAASGLIEKGWIPDWLPETAVNIHEKHDLDTNASILFFEAGAEFSVPSGCEPTTNPPASTFAESWWPRQVESSWSLYNCGVHDYLAVDTATMNVYFWRP